MRKHLWFPFPHSTDVRPDCYYDGIGRLSMASVRIIDGFLVVGLTAWIVSLLQPGRAGMSNTNTARSLRHSGARANPYGDAVEPLETDCGRNNSIRPPSNAGSR